MASSAAANPPRFPPPPTNKDDLDETWGYLEAVLVIIMADLQKGMDMKTYMNFYTAVHNFCTSQKAVSSLQTMNVGSGIAANARGGKLTYESYRWSLTAPAHLLGEELYQMLGQFLNRHLKGIVAESHKYSNEALLSFYIREWERFTQAAKLINHLFRYLNRHWVKREMDEGKKDIYDVYTLHLVHWKSDFFDETHEKVMDAVLMLVEKQRNGETIDQMQLKSIVDSFVSLGLDENDSTKSTLEVYRYFFERPYIAATRTYYQNESKRFVAENSVVEYMKKAESRLEEERGRVDLYLHADIMKRLMDTCHDVLITAHSVLLRDEFQVLLDNERTDDLARMYKLLSRIKDGLDPLRARFETHVRKAGLAAVEKVAAGGDNFEPKVYVDALLEVHSKYQQLVNVAFAGESEFVRSLDNACKEFVNRNQVCKQSSTRSPELLAKYSDQILKKGNKTAEESELEEMLVQIMVVFKYIEDKDVFQKFYSRMLTKRLVHTSSVSDDAETSMISKLKEACGFEYTNKLQRMFNDIQISKDLNTSYREFQDRLLSDNDQKKEVDSTFQVLGTGFWPLNPPTTNYNPPAEITKAKEMFQHFYFDKHNGRKLTWLWQLCKGEIRANYVKMNVKTPYTFQVSMYQMAILLLFNDGDSFDYKEMQETTSISDDVMDSALGILLKAKVLLVQPEGAKAQPGSKYTLNYNFKNKKVKVNLNLPVKSEQKQEAEDTHKTVEEDRKLLLQVSLLRQSYFTGIS